MKVKKLFVFIMILSSFFILFSAFGQQKAHWKGKVEYEKGIRIIKNPPEPLYGEIEFDLEEDLSVGNEDDDNYMFYQIRDIKIDRDENIYVLERGNLRVQKFDRNGNYICTIGKQGQGPGEFQRPFQLIIDNNAGTISVPDMRKLIIFDMNGKYIDEDIFFEEAFYNFVIDSNGSYWGIKFGQEGDDDVTAKMFKAFGKLNTKGKMERVAAKFPYDLYRKRLEGGQILLSSSGFEYDLFFSFVDDQNLVYGFSKKFELNIIDMDGNLLLRILKDEPYRSFSAEEKRTLKKTKVPGYKPFFYAIFSDSEGRIFVQRNNARKIETVAKEFDIFSRDGYHLYKTLFQYTPYIIKNGYYYTRIQNEETGEVFVKRYKIKNWNQIKAGIN